MASFKPPIGRLAFPGRFEWTRSLQSVTLVSKSAREISLENYKILLYRQEDGSWVAKIPSLSGCYALMPTREQALEELNGVFQMISEEYRGKGLALPADTTEIVHA